MAHFDFVVVGYGGETKMIKPFRKNTTVSNSKRQSFHSTRIGNPFTVKEIHFSFALNTQRLLQNSVWVCGSAETPDDQRPAGFNLLAGLGGEDYMVGDGQEGLIKIPINEKFNGGYYLVVESYNADPINSHTVDVTVLYEES